MLPCLRQGFSNFLFRSIASDRAIRLRVSRGMIDVVDEAAMAGDERVGELRAVFPLALGQLGRVALLVAEDDLDRPLRAPSRRSRPKARRS